MKESDNDSLDNHSCKSDDYNENKLDESNQDDIKNSSVNASLIPENPTRIVSGSNSDSQEFKIESNEEENDESQKHQKIVSNNYNLDDKNSNKDKKSEEKIENEKKTLKNDLKKKENHITKINNENLKIISSNIEESDKIKKKRCYLCRNR